MPHRRHGKGFAILNNIVEDYGDTATVHGVRYVLSRKIPHADRAVWLLLLLISLATLVFLANSSYTDWRSNRVVTTLTRTNKPVSELKFPSVTICSQGLRMEAVKNALMVEYDKWKIQRNRKKRSIGETEMVSEFVKDLFGIGNEPEYNLLNILESLASHDVEKTSGFNALRNNMIACKREEKTQMKTDKQGIY